MSSCCACKSEPWGSKFDDPGDGGSVSVDECVCVFTLAEQFEGFEGSCRDGCFLFLADDAVPGEVLGCGILGLFFDADIDADITRALQASEARSEDSSTRCVSNPRSPFGTLLASSSMATTLPFSTLSPSKNNPPSSKPSPAHPPLQNHPLCATLTSMRAALVALLLILLPLACAKPDEQTRQRNLSRKKMLQIPTTKRFAIGDSFTYSNPTTTWQITDIQNNLLVWQSNLGERMITSPNPFLPALLWESRRYGKGRRTISQKKGSLFPLIQGKKIRFNANTTIAKEQTQDPTTQNFTWNCVVGEKQKTTVPAGTFKTFELLCQRKNADALIYRYAPAIARIVEFRTPGLGLARATRRQLIGYNSLAGAAFQGSQAEIGITLSPLRPPAEEEDIPPYRPSLPPVAPLPFAPPSDFFAPQQDSTPSVDPAQEQPATEPLKRLLEEALEEQQNRLPVLPQFQETSPSPGIITPSPQPQLASATWQLQDMQYSLFGSWGYCVEGRGCSYPSACVASFWRTMS